MACIRINVIAIRFRQALMHLCSAWFNFTANRYRTLIGRLSEKSLGTPNRALMNRWNGAKSPILGSPVDNSMAEATTLTIFQIVSVGD